VLDVYFKKASRTGLKKTVEYIINKGKIKFVLVQLIIEKRHY